MKLVVAGLDRSGAASIGMALDQLGMTFLSQETHFKNPEDHAHVNAVLKGEADLNWSMFEGFDATLGWPLCFLYREQLEHFPEAICLLHTCVPEAWFDEVSRVWSTLQIVRSARLIPRLRHLNETLDYLQARMGGPPEKEKWIASYEAYMESVQQNTSPERLVIYQVEEGWEPICSLLNLPIPNETFPRLDEGGEENLLKKMKPLFGIE